MSFAPSTGISDTWRTFCSTIISWAIRYFVVDTSNWWFGKRVLVAPEWIADISWPDRVSLSEGHPPALEECDAV